jgi:MYXO-CTERM domain-containing protein
MAGGGGDGGSGGIADMPGTTGSKHGCSFGGDASAGAATLLVLALFGAVLLARRHFYR